MIEAIKQNAFIFYFPMWSLRQSFDRTICLQIVLFWNENIKETFARETGWKIGFNFLRAKRPYNPTSCGYLILLYVRCSGLFIAYYAWKWKPDSSNTYILYVDWNQIHITMMFYNHTMATLLGNCWEISRYIMLIKTDFLFEVLRIYGHYVEKTIGIICINTTRKMEFPVCLWYFLKMDYRSGVFLYNLSRKPTNRTAQHYWPNDPIKSDRQTHKANEIMVD